MRDRNIGGCNPTKYPKIQTSIFSTNLNNITNNITNTYSKCSGVKF